MMDWNYLCDAVVEGNKNNITEKDFQNKIISFFEGVLFWSSIKKTLRIQYAIEFAHTKGLVDIALLNEAQNVEVIIELKRPNHKQKADDVRQLSDYMKVTGCLFGLYIGEKFELYYNDFNNRLEPKCAVSLNFTKDNLCGNTILEMLENNTYSRDTLEKHCKKLLTVQTAVKHWVSPNGKNEILDFIVKQSHIDEDCVDVLKNLIDVSVVDLSYADSAWQSGQNVFHAKGAHDAKPHDSTLYSFDNENFLSKRAFAFQVIKKITEDYPNMSFYDISSLFTSKTIIRKKAEWEQLPLDSKSRYCDKDNEILKDSNGIEFLVSDQWTKRKIDSVIKNICDHFQWNFYTK